jgi:hypothetical protein
MTIKKIAVYFCVVIVLLNFSCQKDFTNDNIIPTPVTPVLIPNILPVTLPNNPVTFSVVGKITDENNLPVSGANVSGGGVTVISNTNGIFKINNGNFNGNFATIKVEKNNYFSIVKTIASLTSETQFINCKLSAKKLIGKIAATGGALDFASGNVNISFPSNAFVNSIGINVVDSVSIYATFIDPTATDASVRMPGNLTGVESPSTTFQLSSYGMLAVELKNAAGESVKLAVGKKATITSTIPSSLMASAPSTIPLWYFDETNGVWVKQGEAVKVNNTYKGDVSHFTFWNFDINLPQVFFSAKFKNRADSTPVPYSRVTLSLASGNNYEYENLTNSGGYAYGYVPKNLPLRMRFYRFNGNVLLDTIVGPFASSPNNLGNIYINFPALPTPPPIVKGTMLNCNLLPSTRGSVKVVIDSLDYIGMINNLGQFSILLNSVPAVNAQLYVSGIDSTTNTTIPNTTINYVNNNSLNLGIVYACTTPPAQFISYTLDGGTPHLFTRGLDSAFCTTTFVFNRTNIACRRANGTPMVEGYVAFLTGPTVSANMDTSSILTLQQYTTASTPRSLNLVSFTEQYTSYPTSLAVPGWVIGNFNATFRDSASLLHTVSSNFKMWRN